MLRLKVGTCRLKAVVRGLYCNLTAVLRCSAWLGMSARAGSTKESYVGRATALGCRKREISL